MRLRLLVIDLPVPREFALLLPERSECPRISARAEIGSCSGSVTGMTMGTWKTSGGASAGRSCIGVSATIVSWTALAVLAGRASKAGRGHAAATVSTKLWMPLPNIRSLTVPQLLALRDDIDKRLEEHRAELQVQLAQINCASNKSRAKGSRVLPKYRHPGTGETWSGRGDLAAWLAREIDAGRKREDFLIDLQSDGAGDCASVEAGRRRSAGREKGSTSARSRNGIA